MVTWMSKRLLSEKTSLWVKFTSRDVKSLIRFHSFVHFKDTSLWMHIYKWGKILFDPHQQISKRGSAFQPWKVPQKSSSKTQSSRAELTFCWVVKVEFIKLSTQCFLFHVLFYWEIFNTIGMLDVFHCFICPIWPFNLALWLNLSNSSTLVGNLFITDFHVFFFDRNI